MKIPKSIESNAVPVDSAPLETGVEVHLALYGEGEGEPRRFAGVFAAAPGLDELIEMPGETGTYRVTEIRRSVRGLVELKPDASGSLDGAYERLGKRGVPYADEIVFVLAELESETTDATETV